MKLIRGLYNLKNRFANGCVATIGNYDGVHFGHQQILARLREKAAEVNLPAVAIIFEPQPEEFFAEGKSLRLSSLREKIFLFAKYGVNAILVLAFNRHFATITAVEFCQKVLLVALNVRYLIIGDDFSFGHRREGGFALLKSLGLKVEQIPAVRIKGIRVSSSFIRAALLQGDLETANEFLGRPYRVSGRVIHGDHIGRELGFPTANIYLAKHEMPFSGVYAVRVYIADKPPFDGVANIGFRFEVYIINFSANIYGKRITVELCKKIRDEKKFTSFEELQQHIVKDVAMAKSFFARNIFCHVLLRTHDAENDKNC